MIEDSNSMWAIVIIALGIALLELPFTISKWRKLLHGKLPNYNYKEKIMFATSITAIVLAIVLFGLAIAQFVNSIPTLFYTQILAANPVNYAFQDLMWFGVVSGIICSLIGYNLLRVNLKELRIVLSTNSFRKTP